MAVTIPAGQLSAGIQIARSIRVRVAAIVFGSPGQCHLWIEAAHQHAAAVIADRLKQGDTTPPE